MIASAEPLHSKVTSSLKDSAIISVQYENEFKDDPHVLGCVSFNSAINPAEAYPVVPLQQLSANPVLEVWRGRRPVARGRLGELHFSHNGEVLFGFLKKPGIHIESSAEQAYNDIVQASQQLGYPHLIRVWHFFPAINERVNEDERYHAFNKGRHSSLLKSHSLALERLPAATAIGTQGGDLLIYFIASQSPGVSYENPRQVSAYHYPDRYGPKSPSFSRAIAINEEILFISGTASIKGHESKHPDDLVSQFKETIKNLTTIIENSGFIEARSKIWKIYLRDPSLRDTLLELTGHLKTDPEHILLIQGDVCRTDLMIEIEGCLSI